jgi:hypothetical protein
MVRSLVPADALQLAMEQARAVIAAEIIHVEAE